MSELFSSSNPLEFWLRAPLRARHDIIEMLWHSEHERAPVIASLIARCIIDAHTPIKLALAHVNVLCIRMAMTHEPRYLEHIVGLKYARGSDLEFHIDSNLLFEFTAQRDRHTCIRDTLAALDAPDKGHFASVAHEPWFEDFESAARHYARMYGEEVVLRYWALYQAPHYARRLALDEDDLADLSEL